MSITEADIRGATLPVKIDAARRAIQQCEDLPELLRYQDQAQGLAAAVRIMKHVAPELVRSANEMVADAWRKGGELLSRYSNIGGGAVGRRGRRVSPRGVVAKEIGLTRNEVSMMVRIASASQDSVYEAAQKSQCINAVGIRLPRLNSSGRGPKRGGVYKSIMNGALVQGHHYLRKVPLEAFNQLALDERKAVRARIAEIMELLDEMDRLCR